jgi:hypothetical protein
MMDAVVLTQSSGLAPSIVFLGSALLLASGVLLGMMLSLRRVSQEDDRIAKRTRHQRDPRGRGPASLDWIQDPPDPRADAVTPTEVIALPVEITVDHDSRRGR